MTPWTRKSQYHLIGPDGWSVALVHVDGVKHYELWECRGWNDYHCHARCSSADEAKQRYEEITSGSLV
ncbi:hypothetical protein [Crenobacter cavernae]|uniref:hypothetical protein n=1 Tax=Crenobacter cavernae TaxID=2290923 RepID=UPI00100F5C1B|nr:hypothetical protein [Crenobacter cavernae]